MESDNVPGESIHGRYDWSRTPPSYAVVDAVAALENVEPTDPSTSLGVTLFEHVDPEALDAIVEGGDDVALSFAMGDYAVRIDGADLTIRIE